MYQTHTGSAPAGADPEAGQQQLERAPRVGDATGTGRRILEDAFLDRPVPSHNLRLQPTPLLGREHELRSAREQLLSDEIRLLTLTGPAGVGKTRLALALAESVRSAFTHGVWLVELASMQDQAQVTSSICRVLGLGKGGCRAQAAVLQTYLEHRRLLLILDNFEQVMPAATGVADLLATCPQVKIVATSRTRLRLRWEHVRPVGPLACHGPPAPGTIEAVAELPAVALFVRRAQASLPGFAPTTENVEAIVAICERLEGLPLAIELAAARVNSLTLSELLEWIEHCRSGLGWDAQDLPRRHQTLRAAFEWSHALLTPAEQALLRRLSVFAGGWTLEAAVAVTRVEALGLDPQAGLASLVDASLLQASRDGRGKTRFTMLNVLGELAGDRLAVGDDGDEVGSRHAEYFAGLADRAGRGLEGGGRQRQWLECLDLEHENLRAALRWAEARGDGERLLRLASNLAYFWWACGYLSEGREWLARALACGGDAPATARLGALEGIGLLSASLGDARAATDHLGEAVALAHQLGEGHSPMRAVGGLIRTASLRGCPEQHPSLAAALEAARPASDPWSLAFALHGLGLLAYEGRNPVAAIGHLEEAAAICRRTDDHLELTNVLGTLALAEHANGDHARAISLAAEAVEHADRLRFTPTIARCIDVVALVSGDGAPAMVLARLLGAAESLRSTVRLRLSPLHRSSIAAIVAAARQDLGEQAFADARTDGHMMDHDDLVATALAMLERAPTAPQDPPTSRIDPHVHGGLSPREHEVLQYVAAGQTNRQIAEKLIISVATVNYHLTSLLNKLGADNRTQAVTIATQRGLCTDVPGLT